MSDTDPPRDEQEPETYPALFVGGPLDGERRSVPVPVMPEIELHDPADRPKIEDLPGVPSPIPIHCYQLRDTRLDTGERPGVLTYEYEYKEPPPKRKKRKTLKWMRKFCTNLRRIRRELHVTQAELARRTGQWAEGISALERFQRPGISKRLAQELADGLGVKLEKLMGMKPRHDGPVPELRPGASKRIPKEPGGNPK